MKRGLKGSNSPARKLNGALVEQFCKRVGKGEGKIQMKKCSGFATSAYNYNMKFNNCKKRCIYYNNK